MGIFNALGKAVMPSWLKWAGWALLIVGVVSAFAYQRWQITDRDERIIRQVKEIEGHIATTRALANEYERVADENDRNLQAFADYRAEQREVLSTVQKAHEEELKRERIAATILERINHAKPEDDAPTAAVLADTLSRLFDKTRTVPAPQDHNQSREGEG